MTKATRVDSWDSNWLENYLACIRFVICWKIFLQVHAGGHLLNKRNNVFEGCQKVNVSEIKHCWDANQDYNLFIWYTATGGHFELFTFILTLVNLMNKNGVVKRKEKKSEASSIKPNRLKQKWIWITLTITIHFQGPHGRISSGTGPPQRPVPNKMTDTANSCPANTDTRTNTNHHRCLCHDLSFVFATKLASRRIYALNLSSLSKKKKKTYWTVQASFHCHGNNPWFIKAPPKEKGKDVNSVDLLFEE